MSEAVADLIERLSGPLSFYWPIAAAAAVLAVITKRERIFSAMAAVRAEFTTNLLIALFNTLLMAQLLVLPSVWINEFAVAPQFLVKFWQGQPEILQLIAAVFVIDFTAYWRHRLEHTRLLWPIHATHHADTRLHWLSVLRKHPLGFALSALTDALLAIVLGLPLGVIALATIFRTWWGFFIHADVDWTLGLFGLLFISPAAHRLHHIRDERLMGSNYGNTVTLWDKLFGTYVDPEPYRNCETGIEEGTRNVIGELWRPFERRYWGRKKRPEFEQLPFDSQS